MLTKEVEKRIIKEKNLINKSKILIDFLFSAVVDKANSPYTGHLYRVGNKFEDTDKIVIGYMHDVIEDTYITDEDLLNLGFPLDIIESILLVSRLEEESYDDFINRIISSGNINAMMVKRSDLEDNMDMSRIIKPTKKDYDRLEKYKKAYHKIEEALKEKGEILC